MKSTKKTTKETSYKRPLIRIVICLIVIVVGIFRGKIFPIPSGVVDTIITILCIPISLITIFSIYISIFDIVELFETRQKSKKRSLIKPTDCVLKKLEDVMLLVEQNDIIEFEIRTDRGLILAGSSSDCKNSSSNFFDKKYYIEENEYETISDFREAMISFSKDGALAVYAIDGVKQKNNEKRKR